MLKKYILILAIFMSLTLLSNNLIASNQDTKLIKIKIWKCKTHCLKGDIINDISELKPLDYYRNRIYSIEDHNTVYYTAKDNDSSTMSVNLTLLGKINNRKVYHILYNNFNDTESYPELHSIIVERGKGLYSPIYNFFNSTVYCRGDLAGFSVSITDNILKVKIDYGSRNGITNEYFVILNNYKDFSLNNKIAGIICKKLKRDIDYVQFINLLNSSNKGTVGFNDIVVKFTTHIIL